MSKYILSIDQGTTSCRAILYDLNFNIISTSQKEFQQYYPHEGWVEHDAMEIWDSQLLCCQNAILSANISATAILAIGITNQRETIVAWDKSTGIPIYNAIVWQDRRTAPACEIDEIKIGKFNRLKTGLSIDAYFSAPKIRWILQSIPIAKELSDKNQLAIGTIDTWLLWKLTQGEVFATDYSNASRTNIFNIQTLYWDQDLLSHYKIPLSILPEVLPTIGEFGKTQSHFLGAKIPIMSMAGDQQASLFGHQCYDIGMVKNTFGTGCFLLQNIGQDFTQSEKGLLTTIAWYENNQVTYALEGSVFNAGSALKWLKDELQIISEYAEMDSLSNSISSSEQVMMVPAFTGLGAPHWDMYARGMLIGITRNTSKAHIVRATLESLAFQTKDIIDAMNSESDSELKILRVDGGVSESDFLLQNLADILQVPVQRSMSRECTALGVALMAAKANGADLNFPSISSIHTFTPQISTEERNKRYRKWLLAIEKSKDWAREEV